MHVNPISSSLPYFPFSLRFFLLRCYKISGNVVSVNLLSDLKYLLKCQITIQTSSLVKRWKWTYQCYLFITKLTIWICRNYILGRITLLFFKIWDKYSTTSQAAKLLRRLNRLITLLICVDVTVCYRQFIGA